MDGFAEQLLPPSDADQGLGAAQFAQGLALTALAAVVASSVSPLVVPELLAGPPFVLISDSSNLGGSFCKGCRTCLVPYAWPITYCGMVLFTSIFIINLVRFTKEFGTFVGMMERFRLPFPRVMAAGGLSVMFAGTLTYLTGIPVLMECGVVLLLVFLIASTYFGHYKPWRQSKEWNQFVMLLKNIGMCGHCLVSFGFEVPRKGKHMATLRLPGALGSEAVLVKKLCAILGSYSQIFTRSGLLLFVVPFVVLFFHHATNVKQLVDTIVGYGFGRPAATFFAALVLITLRVSSLLYASGLPALMELGAIGLLGFLLGATYFAHLKPFLRSGEKAHFQHLQKNLSLTGACIMTMGRVIPQLRS